MNSRLFKTLLLLLSFAAVSPRAYAQGSTAVQRKVPFGVPLDAKWFNGKWYRVFLETRKVKGVEICSWEDARNRCASLRGRLCVVPDAGTWRFVKELAAGSQLWLGATDQERTGVWKWVDGTPVTFNAWLAGQPDNDRLNEHYLHTWKGGWNDLKDNGRHPDTRLNLQVIGFICEWENKSITTP